jgi:hypothetical protein
MKPLGVVGALLGGLLGAVVWAVIAWKMDVEIGYVAWGIGFAVGFGSVLLGGSGQTNGIMCAVVALLSIFCGKIGAAMAILPEVLHKEAVSRGLGPEQEKEVMAKVKFSDYIDGAKETLGAMDILFGFLGVATAFRIGSSGKGAESRTTVDPNRPVNLSGPTQVPPPNDPFPSSPPSPPPAVADSPPAMPPQDEPPKPPPPAE